MKTLIIIRHSKSSWKNANLSDHERPLNKRGNNDARLISDFLSNIISNVDILHCSSSQRTRETADYFIKKINFTHPYLNIKTFEMQKRLNSLQGKKRTWFSGSYFGYGFHEDGLKSSLEMLKQFEGKDGDMHIQGHSYASKI